MKRIRKQKSRLTRRVARLYSQILNNNADWWLWDYGSWRKTKEELWQIQALTFARQWGGRMNVDLKRLEGIVVRGPNPMHMVAFAARVPGAGLRRIQRAVLERGRPDAIRALMRVPGIHPKALEEALLVAEVMDA